MKTRIIAHRGGASLWPALMAFDQALRLGCDGLEMDLQRKDDVLLFTICHFRADSTRRNGEWLISFHPLSSKALHAKNWQILR